MKSTAIACTIAAASLGLGSLSFAQPDDRRGAREAPARIQQHAERRTDPPHQNRYQRSDQRRSDKRFDIRDERRFDYSDARRNDRRYYYNARTPEFRRGGYIPREFRSHHYVVTNYRTYHLSPPPRGHQWVQVGADDVLIAIATGLIAHIVLNY